MARIRAVFRTFAQKCPRQRQGRIWHDSSGVWKTFSKITRGASWAKNSNSGERLPTGNGKNANQNGKFDDWRITDLAHSNFLTTAP